MALSVSSKQGEPTMARKKKLQNPNCRIPKKSPRPTPKLHNGPPLVRSHPEAGQEGHQRPADELGIAQAFMDMMGKLLANPIASPRPR
jgi:hypothetical protein